MDFEKRTDYRAGMERHVFDCVAFTSARENRRNMSDNTTPGPLSETDRNSLLSMSDEDLLARCRVDRFRGTGRGGQKRNRTDSAIRVTHTDSGLSATCDQTRSQHANRRLALRRLRLEIALECRSEEPPVWEEHWPVTPRAVQYPRYAAVLLDALWTADYRVREAARTLGLSTGRLVRCLSKNTTLWQIVNRERRSRGLKPLKPT